MSNNFRPSPSCEQVRYPTYNPCGETSAGPSSSVAIRLLPLPSAARRVPPPVSSVYPEYNHVQSEYSAAPNTTEEITVFFEDRLPPVHTRPAPGWTPPVVRGRDPPFPPPRGRRYPVAPRQNYISPAPPEPPVPGLPPLPDIRPPHRRIERGRGTMISSPTGTDEDLRRRADMYFDYTLSEWRPIPSSTQMGIPEENWARLGEGKVEKEKKRDKLKKFGRNLILVVKDLGNLQEKRDTDNKKRKSKLAASVSAPLGTTRHGRR